MMPVSWVRLKFFFKEIHTVVSSLYEILCPLHIDKPTFHNFPKAAGHQHLQFTVEIWTTEENSPIPVKEERVQIVTNDAFPFLDMKMSWCPEGDLQFIVFRKKGQQLKYVGKESIHTPVTL